MKILVLFEESGTVTDAFIEAGHDAYSVDLLPTRGRNPDKHLQKNADEVMGWIESGMLGHVDMVIAFPPCDYLTNAGVRWLHTEDGRWDKMRDGAERFKRVLDLPVKYICAENPVPHKYAREIIGRPTQYVQPYDFGHMETKKTGLWLKNLPPLTPTNDVKAETMALPYGERAKVHYCSPGPLRKRIRSETKNGLAEAMLTQWGNIND